MTDLDLDPTQLDRYSRHIIMDEVGPEGQSKLLDAEVLVLGAGGLGSPIIQYLAAAGVGTLGIADDDVVERSNLQRQIVHGTDDVGRPKVDSAAEFVAGLNPDVDIRRHEIRVDPDDIEELIGEYDFVVDGTDNFRTRYLVNDACTLAGVPFSHGSIFRFEGQVTTFAGGEDSPCYRCLFPEAPPEGMVPNCATAGVLGVLPGTVGCIQATETVKAILGKGDLLDGRMVFYDAFHMDFDTVEINRDPDCPVCGEDPAIDSVNDVEYTASCAIDAGAADADQPGIGAQ
jgi:adenylyltransferase/sulfurtransferase